MTNTALRCRHDEVAGQSEGKAGPRRWPFDGCDHGLGKGADRLDPVVQTFDAAGLHLGGLLPVGLQALQVATGAEYRAFARNHHAAHLGAASAAFSASTPAA
jgi:hypothetical protein